MRLDSGARLGPYEIVGPLGAGGMGEVYRARDTRLDRTVAIKVLHPELSADPGLRRRFEREARAISSLNHPHICTLYDLGRDAGVDFLVMEYLEGETLGSRLARGLLPLEQTIRCAVELAGALDSAHRKGVIHRDLKPGNIFLTRSGAKILDFGLARLQAEKVAPPAESLATMPTESRQQPLTEAGTILGTVQYMAPEQLEGKEADARTDIFSLGEVIYEMLTGASPFKGASRASLIGAILHVEPQPLSSIQPLIPKALERAIGRCLAKDPEERWQTARDLASELQWIAGGGTQAKLPGPAAAPRKLWSAAGLALAGLALLAVIALAVRPLGKNQETPPSVSFSVLPPEGATFPDSFEEHNFAVSPDGRTLAFVADRNGQALLWLRVLDETQAKLLPGTDGAASPFWSPDSRMIAFFADGKLKKIAASGGPSQSLCPVSGNNTGSWGGGRVILFTQHFTEHETLCRVGESGGEPVALLDSEQSKEMARPRWPVFLPDGRHYLFLASDPEGELRLYGGGLGAREFKTVAKLRSRVAYMSPGRLLYVSEGNLMMQPFDANELRFTGEPVPIMEHLPSFITGWAPFSISENGALAYRAEMNPSQLSWRDRGGRVVGTLGHAALYRSFRLSPDGEKVVLEIKDSSTGTTDLWLYEMSRDLLTRFTRDPALESEPAWSPDGRQIVFTSHGGTVPPGLRLKAASGDDSEGVSLVQGFEFASDWSPDGRLVLYQLLDPKLGWQMWTVSMIGEHTSAQFRKSPYQEGSGIFSPDGRWLAFVGGQSGGPEVYVTPAGGSGDRWQVSTSGGLEPRWRRDGKELFYRASDGTLMAVPVKAGDKFATGPPVPLFRIESSVVTNGYDVSADGQRFLVNPSISSGTVPITFVVNWPGVAKVLKTK